MAARIVSAVQIPGPVGPLEGLWADPGQGLPAAVICHPHPAHGGSMHSKVVHTVHRVLDQAGHPTLRFNFRGVGTSGGAYSGGDGGSGLGRPASRGRRRAWSRSGSRDSRSDRTLARWALGDGHRAVHRARHAGEQNIDGRTFDFLDRPPAPMLIVQGDHDQYGSVADIQALVARLKSEAVSGWFVTDADHFFTDD
jgi:alpha/beta superfamily hydrolase